MAPRKSKSTEDDASSTTSELPPVLKPKTEKAKVEKIKSEKPKVAKPKVEKTDKMKAVKKEKATVDGEKEKGGVKKGDGESGGVGKKGEKEKAKAVNGEEAIEIMARYLREQNRPYSATEVSANLHGKVTKTVADKLLKEMEQNGQIMGKATKKDGGGQWVFWAIQNPADTATPTQLLEMDTTITTLRETLPSLKSNLKILTTKLNTLKSAPTTADLHIMIETLKEENKGKIEKLRGFKEGTVKIVTREEVQIAEREERYWLGKRRARKSAFEGLEGVLREGMTREEIWERAGLEEDCY